MSAIDNVKAALMEAQQANRHYQKAAAILAGGPASFYFEKVTQYINALFDRFAPFHVGDRVRLIASPNADGWSGYRHFLVAGAKGTVSELDYNDEQFIARVIFDDESWLDSEGNIHAAEDKHTFAISEKLLERTET